LPRVPDEDVHSLDPLALLDVQGHVEVVDPGRVDALGELAHLGGHGQVGVDADDVVAGQGLADVDDAGIDERLAAGQADLPGLAGRGEETADALRVQGLGDRGVVVGKITVFAAEIAFPRHVPDHSVGRDVHDFRPPCTVVPHCP
jgi:hypothetical protein